MADRSEEGATRRSAVGLVLTDAQFWIPVIVLVLGLFVLRWIH